MSTSPMCECGHIHEAHAYGGKCTIAGCKCSAFVEDWGDRPGLVTIVDEVADVTPEQWDRLAGIGSTDVQPPRQISTEPRCGNCFYFRANANGGGTCHRYAPRPKADGTSVTAAYWPRIALDDWCGEHRAGVIGS